MDNFVSKLYLLHSLCNIMDNDFQPLRIDNDELLHVNKLQLDFWSIIHKIRGATETSMIKNKINKLAYDLVEYLNFHTNKFGTPSGDDEKIVDDPIAIKNNNNYVKYI